MFVFWWKKQQRGEIDDTENKVEKTKTTQKWCPWVEKGCKEQRKGPDSKNGSSFAIKGKEKYIGTDSRRVIDLMIEYLEILF